LDSLIVMADLKIVNRVDSAKHDITQTADIWNEFYKGFHPDNDIKKIKEDFLSIDPKQINTLPEVMSTLDRVKSARKTISDLSDTIGVKQIEIQQDFSRLSKYARDIDDWLKEDYQQILKKAKLPDLNVKNIGKMLFGREIVNRINSYLGYLQTIRKYMPEKSDKEKEETPERMAGLNIAFPDRLGYPKFLIRKIQLSGQTRASDENPGLVMSGDITGITSQPWIYGKPTVIDLKGLQQDKLSGIFTGILNHTTDISSDSFNIQFKNKALNDMSIAKTPYLPNKINKGKADFTGIVRFKKEQLLARIDIDAHALKFDFAQSQTKNRFVGIVQEVMSGIDVVTLHAKAAGKADNLDFKFDSNLDDLVSKKLKAMGSQALTDAQNKIRDRLNKIRDEKMAEANKIYDEKKKAIMDKIDDYKNKVDELKQKIEAKKNELEEEIKARKKAEEDKLKNKAKEGIDNLLQKKTKKP
ncbi:TIGR03545 family protein, partial [candidate division KSB1 bacterium]|nr:TIGR03545 family protein [candidate division KSB1 bacterium]